MAKKTRKVLKQESQQRAIQQAQANMNTVNNAPSAVEPAAITVTARPPKAEAITSDQEFAFVKSDVRRSLTLAGIFTAVMIVLSFVVR